ncbi:MAG: PD-(D/E)XK nuclease family transposase [Defluviitaleaceae bacterium]|nr:PD-(D/E)XK nuclease family transposase [Defluviitaleaceae bacterium]
MGKVKPTNDLAFKKTLSSEENKDILQGLISDFYEVEVENLVIENPYSISDYKEILEGKEIFRLRPTIKDIAASFKIADFVSECQIRASKFFDERAVYYPFDRFCRNYNKAGAMLLDSEGRPNRYSSLRPVYALNILGYTHFQKTDGADDDALHIFEFYDIKHQRRYERDLVKVAFFELTKNQGLTANQGHWLDYFNKGVVDRTAPDYIKKASQVIEFTNMAEEEKIVIAELEKAEAIRVAENQQSFLDGQNQGFIEGQNRGFLEGQNQGFLEGQQILKVETAKLMLSYGEPIEKIIRFTGLSADFVESL